MTKRNLQILPFKTNDLLTQLWYEIQRYILWQPYKEAHYADNKS